MKLGLYLITYTKTNSTRILPKIRGKTTNLLEESIRVSLHDYGLDSSFLAKTPEAQAIKE